MQLFTLVLVAMAGLTSALPAEVGQRDATVQTWIPAIPNVICATSPNVRTAMNSYTAPPSRSNIVDGQKGVTMLLDVGVVDTASCKPMVGATVEVWSSNPVGRFGSFLRGSAKTGSNGIAEFNTLFPGFASDGANHVNILVRPPGSSASAYVGEAFFTDPWTNIISKYGPYAANTNKRVLNSQDANFRTASSGSYTAIIDVLSIQDDWPEGVSGYITVGVDPSASV